MLTAAGAMPGSSSGPTARVAGDAPAQLSPTPPSRPQGGRSFRAGRQSVPRGRSCRGRAGGSPRTARGVPRPDPQGVSQGARSAGRIPAVRRVPA